MTQPSRPACPIGTKLMQLLADQLRAMPEHCHIDQETIDEWSSYLGETGISEKQIVELASWYAQYHNTHPTRGYLVKAATHLAMVGSLPDHRLLTENEASALMLIQQAAKMGISREDCAQVFLLAGAISNAATSVVTDREFVRNQAITHLIFGDMEADEILDDIEAGKSLPGVREYLLP